MHTQQWKELNQVRELLQQQIDATERKMPGFLVQTRYGQLLSVPGISRGVGRCCVTDASGLFGLLGHLGV